MKTYRAETRWAFVLLAASLSLLLVGCGSADTSEGSTNRVANHHDAGSACPGGQEPDRTVKLTERAWKYFPDNIEVNRGDIVKVTFKTTDNGIGAGHGFAIEGFEQQVFLNGVTKGNPESTCFEANKPPGDYTFYCATQCSTDKRHTEMEGTLTIRPKDAKLSESGGDSKDGKSYEELSREAKWEQVQLPPRSEHSQDLVERGKKLYNGKLACASCHGPSGKGDGPAAANLTNTETGEPISPRNFQDPENYKWGDSREAIARTVLTGGKNAGSPMPPMKGSVKPEELWAVVSYVKSLQE